MKKINFLFNYKSILFVSSRALPILFWMLFLSLNANGQSASCNAFTYEELVVKANPEYTAKKEQIEKRIYETTKKKVEKSMPPGGYVIPVAVHVVHYANDPLGTGTNISNQAITDAIATLNQAYQGTAISPPLNNNNQPIGISFCLASIDRDANDQLTDLDIYTEDNPNNPAGSIKTFIGDINHFPRTDFLNIWIVNSICNNGNCTVNGYSTLPPAHGSWYDGVVIERTSIAGSDLVHEVGHYFNLLHTFGTDDETANCTNNDCNEDNDKVCDTNPDGSLHTCETTNYCHTDALGGLPFDFDDNDPVGNYMDYGDCLINFTVGQRDRMWLAIDNVRSSLLLNTGGCCPAGPMEASFAYTINPNGTINLDASESMPPSGLTYHWKIGDIQLPPTNNAMLNNQALPQGNTVIICLTIEGASPDCKDTKCTNIYIGSNGCNYIVNMDMESPVNNYDPSAFYYNQIPNWECAGGSPSYSSVGGLSNAPENAGAAHLIGSVFSFYPSPDFEAVRATTDVLPKNTKYLFSMYKKSAFKPSESCGIKLKTKVFLDRDSNGDGTADNIDTHPGFQHTLCLSGGQASFFMANNAMTIFEDAGYPDNTEYERFINCFELGANDFNLKDVVIVPWEIPQQSCYYNDYVSLYTHVELVKDYFDKAAGQDKEINCPRVITLGIDEGCNLTDVYYTWEKVVSPNVYVKLAENLPTPKFDFLVEKTTTFRLTRVFKDYEGNPVTACAGMPMEDFVTITVTNATPNPTFTFDPPGSCATEVCFNSVEEGTDVTHLWQSVPPAVSSSEEDPCLTFPTVGTYQVSHTVHSDECGTYVQTQSVVISCTDPGFMYDAPDCSNTLHFTSAGVGNHLWELVKNGVTLQTFSGATTNITFPGTGTFIVKHSINGGTASQQTFTFIGADINSVTLASTLPLNGLTDQFVSFKGTLEIDVPAYYFVNIIGRMGEGATVKVNTGKSLRVDNSKLRSCDKMWKGFNALAGSSLAITGSTVNDAQFAVKANGLAVGASGSPATVSLTNNDFDKNFISVYVPRGGTGKAQNVVFSGLSGNDFTCTSTLKPKYPGQDQFQALDTWIPLTGTWSYTGIWVAELSNIGVGAGNGVKNTFTDLRNGICAERSIMSVVNSTFKTMQVDNSYSGFQTGAGIYTTTVLGTSGQLTQLGLGDAGPNSFESCRWGILSRGTKVTINANKMEKVVFGVSVQNCIQGSITIAGNTINAYTTGIELLHNGRPAVNLSVKSNKVNIWNQPSTIFSLNKWGIRVEDDDMAYSGGTINLNEVKLNSNNSIGISLNVAKDVVVINNNVSINVNSKATGINISGGTNGLLQDNTVTGLSTSAPTVGIFVDNNEGIFYCCNTVDQTKTGFSIQGNSDSEDGFQANNFNNHQTALVLSPTAITSVLGTQLHMGNKWCVTSNPVSAQYNGSFQDVSANQFTVDTSFSCFMPPPATIIPSTLFLPIVGGTNPKCPIVPTCGACNINCFGGNPTEFEKRLAQNSPDVQNFNAVVKWQGERSLYKSLTDNPSQIGGLSYLQNFYNQNMGTATGDFYNVDNGIRNLFALSSNQSSQLATNQASIENFQALLNVKREAMLNATPAQASALESEMQVLILQMSTVVDANEQLLTGILSNIIQNAPSVKATNSNINAAPVFQANEKTVNNILLTAIGNGGLDFASSQQVLQAIASQCPYVGGNAVFRARSMVALIDNTVSYDDANICQPNFDGQNLPPSAAIKTAGTALFYPNPASDWLTVGYNFPDAKDLILSILNSNGMEVEQVKLPVGGGNEKISISKLSSGIYYCKIIENGKMSVVEKLVIIR